MSNSNQATNDHPLIEKLIQQHQSSDALLPRLKESKNISENLFKELMKDFIDWLVEFWPSTGSVPTNIGSFENAGTWLLRGILVFLIIALIIWVIRYLYLRKSKSPSWQLKKGDAAEFKQQELELLQKEMLKAKQQKQFQRLFRLRWLLWLHQNHLPLSLTPTESATKNLMSQDYANSCYGWMFSHNRPSLAEYNEFHRSLEANHRKIQNR